MEGYKRIQPNRKSMKEALAGNLLDVNKACRLLFESFHVLSGQHNNQTIVHNHLILLIESDRVLQKTLSQLEQHLKYQLEIVSIQKEIQEKDRIIETMASALKSAERRLEDDIDEYGVKKTKGEEKEVSPEDLISYAHKISGTTSAPFGYQPHLALMPLYKPPAPQEEMMRASYLFNRLPLNLLRFYGLAEKDLVTTTNTTSTTTTTNNITSPKDSSSPNDMMNTSQEISTQHQLKDIDITLQSQQQQQQLSQQKQQISSSNNGIPVITTPPLRQPQPFSATSIDLDLNPDMDDDDDDDNDDDDESGDSSDNDEVEWD